MSTQNRGAFLSLEGIDSVGKSGHLSRLREELTDEGHEVVGVTDPPSIEPWAGLRETFQHSTRIARIAEAHLLHAARIDNFNRVIEPNLEEGKVVVADRYTDSWIAYQSIRLEDHFVSEEAAREYLLEVQNRALGAGILKLPDVTLLITDDPEVAMSRSTAVGKDSKYEKLEIQRRVSDQYDKLATMFPDRIKPVPIDGREQDAVYEDLKARVADHIGRCATEASVEKEF